MECPPANVHVSPVTNPPQHGKDTKLGATAPAQCPHLCPSWVLNISGYKFWFVFQLKQEHHSKPESEHNHIMLDIYQVENQLASDAFKGCHPNFSTLLPWEKYVGMELVIILWPGQML